MRCTRAQSLFSSYLENSIDNSLRIVFEEHLAACPRCKAAYDRFHAAVLMLEEMPEVEPPPDLHANVMMHVQRARQSAPKPVRWWQIDWQHVFTIRVPARAAAIGLAVLLLVVTAFQLTPLNTTVANIFGIRQSSSNDTSIGIGEELVNPWRPWDSQTKKDSGLLISVRHVSGNNYDLRLSTDWEKPVSFAINAGDKSYNGVVAKNQDAGIRLSPSRDTGLMIAKVLWHRENMPKVEYVLLPARFNEYSSRERLTITLQNTTIREVLSQIAKAYGIVLLVSGDLNKTIAYAAAKDANPSEALYGCLGSVGMSSKALANSIYVVEPVR